MTTRRRILTIVTIAMVIVVGFGVDRIHRPAQAGDDAVAIAMRMPTASPTRALASTWFCAIGTAAADRPADMTVIVGNATPAPVKATVTVVGTDVDPKQVPLDVPARSRVGLRVADVISSDYVAATVDVPSGGVAVEHEVKGPLGVSVAPCASSGSEHWYVADGSTVRDDTMLLALYNPFPEDAIVDLSFTHEEGRAVPSDFQGVVVRGGRLKVINVGDHVRRRARVAATVVTRSGRVVVDRLQLRQGSAKGMSVSLAAPSAGGDWWFPDGLVDDGVVERYSIYNPGADEAQVSLELTLDSGAAEPFDLTVPARGRVDLNANDEERIPHNVAHAARVVSLNGVPVVAERAVSFKSPATRSGTSETFGARRTARRWFFVAGAVSDALDEWVSVVNPGTTPVQVTFTVLASGQPVPVEGLQDVEVAAGARRSFRLGDHVKRDDLPLVVEAVGGAIVAERAVYVVGGPGTSLSPGVPLR